jgi:hypothetical protein
VWCTGEVSMVGEKMVSAAPTCSRCNEVPPGDDDDVHLSTTAHSGAIVKLAISKGPLLNIAPFPHLATLCLSQSTAMASRTIPWSSIPTLRELYRTGSLVAPRQPVSAPVDALLDRVSLMCV